MFMQRAMSCWTVAQASLQKRPFAQLIHNDDPIPVQFLTSKQRSNYGRYVALGLVVNIIVLWNTIYIDAVLAQLRQEGYLVRDEEVARLSPFVHKRHINLLGRYSFAVPEAVSRGELRPLRNPDDPDA